MLNDKFEFVGQIAFPSGGRGTTKWWMRLPSQHKIKDLSLFVMLTRYDHIRQLPGDIPATATFPGRGRQNCGTAAVISAAGGR